MPTTLFEEGLRGKIMLRKKGKKLDLAFNNVKPKEKSFVFD